MVKSAVGKAIRWLLWPVLLMLTWSSASSDETPGYTGVGVFEMPALAQFQATALTRAQIGDLPGAAAAFDKLIEKYPNAAALWVNRGILAALQQETEIAIAALLKADALGADRLGTLMARPEMAALAQDPRLKDLADRSVEPVLADPALVKEGQALVGPGNTAWDPQAQRLVSRFTFPPVLRTHSFLDKARAKGPLADLQRLVAQGRAAGNVGDLYDNRDDGHSKLQSGRRTQLTQILFDAPTLGNSSTAITKGNLWRSQPRFAMSNQRDAFRLWQLYANNHIYVFPSVRDHNPKAEKGFGDLFPANTPYVLISQGRSSSDRPHLRAIQTILAALPRDVKARLTAEKLIAPMVQQIFRRGLKDVGPDDYMTPKAHQSVVRGEDIDLGAMIRLAQAVRVDEIPPIVTLTMRRESPSDHTIFADGLTEKLFDTPGAIARIWRGMRPERQYEIEALAEDPNGRPLTFHWRVLRGDAQRIGIEPMNDTGNRVRITLPWHDLAPVLGRPEGAPPIASPRVDIAVFADNGVQISAPAFFTMLYPAHQARTHDAEGRLLSIDHKVVPSTYVDPVIWPRRDWEDQLLHDADRRIIGWTRRRGKQPARSFTAHGLEVLEMDGDGRPALARRVSYVLVPHKNGRLDVVETPGDERYRYTYADPADRIGTPRLAVE